MKKSIRLGLALCAICLNSLSVFAASDDPYPASNFQPKVTYIDESIAGNTEVTATTVVDEKYPAANFQSKVIYSDDSVTASSEPAQADQFDPKYPAAYFKPRVIYP